MKKSVNRGKSPGSGWQPEPLRIANNVKAPDSTYYGDTMNSYIGSLRYDPSGRKRKSPGLKTKRKLKPEFQPLVLEKTLAEKQMDEFNAKYPSYSGKTTYTPGKDQSWKQEASKNFTVAPAYNKGAYQVIPSKDIKHIGK